MQVDYSADMKQVTIDGKLYYRPVTCQQAMVPNRVFLITSPGDLQGYLNNAKPGDLIELAAGTYPMPLNCPVGGTDTAPIIITCAQGAIGKVFIEPPESFFKGDIHGAVVTILKNYVHVNGLVLKGGLSYPGITSDLFGANGIKWQSGGGFSNVTNCIIYKAAHCGVKEMGHGGTNISIIGNIIFGCGVEARDHGIYLGNYAKLTGNLVFDCFGAGIHAYSNPINMDVQKNIIWGCKNWGILNAAKNSIFNKNTVVGCKFGLMYFRTQCSGNTVTKNIICFNGTNVVADAGNGTVPPVGNADSGNCYFPSFVVPKYMADQFGAEITADPLFTDQLNNDYRLQSGSPAVETIKIDIGAY